MIREKRPVSAGRFSRIITRYFNRFFDKEPSCIVIVTDGRGDYPAQEEARGVPVLWLLYGSAPFPPWGKRARIPRQGT